MADPFDYEAAVVAMIAMRVNTPYREQLDTGYQEMLAEFQEAAIAADGEAQAREYMLLTTLDFAQLAVAFLAEATGVGDQEWLQRIAVRFRELDVGGDA